MVNSPNLSTEAICHMLGTKSSVPLTPDDMAKNLRVAFYPGVFRSSHLEDFVARLRSALISSGVNVISYEQALAEGHGGRIGEGIVLIAPGEGETGNLAIDHVASLSKNIVVGVLNGAVPGIGETGFQKRVSALVNALVWHMAHVLIYVDELSWTICNMNGAMDTFSLGNLEPRIVDSLIPKLAAPVIPPQKDDLDLHPGTFDVSAPEYRVPVKDMLDGCATWGTTGLLVSQTKIEGLTFRNKRYRHIAGSYLNWRTGMSYGFLARQLPVSIKPAVEFGDAGPLLRSLNWSAKDFLEIDDSTLIGIGMNNSRFLLRIPEISVLCTRSGCEKTDLDPQKDLIKLVLRQGRIIMETPRGIEEESDCQPSFDTTVILAHAVGNAIVGSILAKMRPSSKFYLSLVREGLALAHWHGFLSASRLPAGYYLHGRNNPAVSCSTPQSAIYALSGKLAVLQRAIQKETEYLGDVQEEPSHGTNITGESLVGLAHVVLEAGMR